MLIHEKKVEGEWLHPVLPFRVFPDSEQSSESGKSRVDESLSVSPGIEPTLRTGLAIMPELMPRFNVGIGVIAKSSENSEKIGGMVVGPENVPVYSEIERTESQIGHPLLDADTRERSVETHTACGSAHVSIC